VRNLKELKGLPMRVMGAPIQTKIFSAIGAAPTVIAYSETYNAIQSGVINALDNEAAGMVQMKFEAGTISRAALWQHYLEEQERVRTLNENSSGGDFYRSMGARTSKRFARAIVSSTLGGLTSFPDAFRMLGMRKTATFYEAARELGVLTA
jgi:TRAP-type mannitol/chloroaromatic compound transport system substrate-binding protein